MAPALLEDVEAEAFAGLKWWSVEEIRNSPEVFAPHRLADLLSLLLAGEIPPEPIEAGV